MSRPEMSRQPSSHHPSHCAAHHPFHRPSHCTAHLHVTPCSVQTKEKMDLDDEERMAQFIDRQIEKAEAELPMDEVSPPAVWRGGERRGV